MTLQEIAHHYARISIREPADIVEGRILAALKQLREELAQHAESYPVSGVWLPAHDIVRNVALAIRRYGGQ